MKQKLLKKKVFNVAKLFVISLALCTSNNAVAMNDVNRNAPVNNQQHMQVRPRNNEENLIKEKQKLLINVGGVIANLFVLLLNNANTFNATTAVTSLLGACNSFENTQHDWKCNSIKQNTRNVSDISASLFTTISSSLSALGKNGDAFSYMSAIPNIIIHLMSFSDTLEKDTKEQKKQSFIKMFANSFYIAGTVSKQVPCIAIGNIFDAIFSMYCFSIFYAIHRIVVLNNVMIMPIE